MNDFIQLKNLIPKAIAKYKMTREARAAHVCERFRRLAPDLIGEDVLNHVRPKFFKGHTLYLSVPNSGWAQRVYIHRHDLIMRLNLDAENEDVHEVRAYVEG